MSAQIGAEQQGGRIGREHRDWLEDYRRVRARSEALTAPLGVEDQCIQTIPEVSPSKWHLAHVSWFFETFLLQPYLSDYREFHPRFGFLFNSYYYGVGPMHARPRRGLLSRPTLDEVMAYRRHVDDHMVRLLAQLAHPQRRDIELRSEMGLHHEQQHQELMLTDIKHVLASNPLQPAYDAGLPRLDGAATSLTWHDFEGGLLAIGAEPGSFAYDNEQPRHQVFLHPFRLASRPVSNGEYLAFIEDGGYQQAEHWLADGWSTIGREGWQAPLYWTQQETGWSEMTLAGPRPLDSAAPVAHLSYYEADAYARWAGCRLPTEAEWEVAVADVPLTGNLVSSGCLQPMPACAGGESLQQCYGDVWEWTQSPYSPYHGFAPLAGELGEYNGKFMSGQFVLRGGSCVTADDHIRASYRNFFYPHDRWQFSGLRLARDSP